MMKIFAVFLLVLAAAYCQEKEQLTDAEFALYKEENPEEFSDKYEGDIMTDKNFRTVGANNRKWAWNTVPYDVSMMKPRAQQKIKEALADMQSKIGSWCIKFVPRTTQWSYVKIISGKGCYSYVGNTGMWGGQPMSLGEGCLRHKTIQHQFMHALGFIHEFNRFDRDNYLKITWDNMKPEYRSMFRKLPGDTLQTAYRYDSIMHYGRYAFSMNGLPTLQKTDRWKKHDSLGKLGTKQLTDMDIYRARIYYNCIKPHCFDQLAGDICEKNKMNCLWSFEIRTKCRKTCNSCIIGYV